MSENRTELENLFKDFINECRFSACLRKETIRGYKAVFTLFLKVVPEVVSLENLTAPIFREFFERIEKRERIVGKGVIKTGVKRSTIKTQWSKLNVFLKWLKENGHIDKNPLSEIKKPRVSYDDYKSLKKEETDKIYASITLNYRNGLDLHRDTMMVSLLLFCGLRRGELVSLQVKDVDLENKLLTVRGETSKSKKTRIIPMHDILVAHIKSYFKERRSLKTEKLIVSTNTDNGLTIEGLRHWVKSLEKKSGIRFHLHQFRHTFACKLAEKNVNLFKIQKLMGHSSITMTEKYARSIKSEDLALDIDKMDI